MRRTKEMAMILASAMVLGTLTGCGTQAKSAAEDQTAAAQENKTEEDRLMDAMTAESSVGAQMAQKQN